MSGLFLLLVVGLWAYLCRKLTRAVLSRLKDGWWRMPIGAALFGTLFILPVADEIVAGFQFRALCEANAKLRIDAQRIRGATVMLIIRPANEILPDISLKTYHSHYSYVDTTSGQELASYHLYSVKGGWLIRTLGISENTSPLTIAPSHCSPETGGRLDEIYGFALVN